MTFFRLVPLVFISLPAQQDMRGLVEAALDQPTELKIDNLPMVDAFDRIVLNTGVEVSIAQETLDLLPYGRNTRLSADIRNVSLREGLERMTAPLGLEIVVRSRGVELVPSPPLSRIGRRATFDELETLATLHDQRLNQWLANSDDWSRRVHFQLDQISDAAEQLRAAVDALGDQPACRALTGACDRLGWTWYPSGDGVTVARKIDVQLRGPVSLRQTGRKLIDVLQSLGKESGVAIRCEPGALAALPLRTQSNFSLYVENKPLSESLQLVSATTGLGYRVEPDAVVFYDPAAGTGPVGSGVSEYRAAPSRPRSVDPFVGKIALPPGPDGTQIELFVRESDLTPEVNALRKKHLDRANETIKAALESLEEETAAP